MSTPRMTHGFVRIVSRSLGRCELLHVPRQAFDIERARRQHAAYLAALEIAGVSVTVLPEEPDLPDSTFVEDPAIVLDEMAVICRLGAASRELESEKIEQAVTNFRPVRRMVPPATLEGGDVLRIGRTLFVGASTRTNREGRQQLEKLVAPFGYSVVEVGVKGCLHLKTGVTSPAAGVLILNDRWIDPTPFRHLEILNVPAEEPWGANTLAVNGTVLVTASSPMTAALLESKGLRVHRLEISELQKAEAGLTCLSVLFSHAPPSLLGR